MKIAVRKPAALLPLPTPAAATPFELPTGSVVLFHDADWAGPRFEISTDQWRADVRHDLTGHCQTGKAAWVAFNLPAHQVLTLTKHHQDLEAGQRICDLRKVAQVADLVGTGRTEAVDLAKIDMVDAVASFFWRHVDLSMGAVELYSDAAFKGNRTVLFLSEWPRGELHTLADWAIEDRLGSTRWSSMADMQYCDLYQHVDGLGKQYPRMSGWQTERRASPDTSKYSFNEMVSAFRWNTLVTDRRGLSSANMDVLIDPLNVTKFMMHRHEPLAIA